MERRGLRSPHGRVLLLSTTHGAETPALATAIAVIDTYTEVDITNRRHALGDRLAAGIRQAADGAGVAEHVVRGRASSLVFATLDADGKPSQPFLRQLITGGIIGPSFVVSAALTETDIDHTIDTVVNACTVYRKALDNIDPSPWLGGRPVKPVFRRFA
jgi:glutamate-1-semialdehyde 2,1-aminomutase